MLFAHQAAQSQQFELSYQERPLEDVFLDLTLTYQVLFKYKDEWVQDKKVTVSKHINSLDEGLKAILQNTGLTYEKFDFLVIILDESEKVKLPEYRIRGRMILAETEEPIPNGLIVIDNSETVRADLSGKFEVALPYGKHQLLFRSGQTKDEIANVFLRQDTTITVAMFDNIIYLHGVVVDGQSEQQQLSQARSSIETIQLESIRTLPTLMGEVDVTRSINTVTGVSSAGEGASGFNVRGGDIDQNLILLDDIPIYNSSHLLGFFSVFNPDAVGSFSLYKGAFPIEHGGRLSSLLEVNMVNPNKEVVTAEGTFGPINNKLKAEIPLKKEKTSVLVAGRHANPSIVLQNFKGNSQARNAKASYHDVNFKLQHVPSATDNFTVSGYLSKDLFSFFGDTTYDYRSSGFSVRWNHAFSSSLTSNFIVFSGHYEALLEDLSPSRQVSIQNGLTHSGAKVNFSYLLDNQGLVDFGVSSQLLEMRSDRTQTLGPDPFLFNGIPHDRGVITDLYASVDWSFDKLAIDGGLRYNIFKNLNSEKFLYDGGSPRDVSTINDTVTVGTSYDGLEPRISVSYLLTNSFSIKASGGINRQYIHLFSNSTASLPTDIWRLSDINISPSSVSFGTIGLYKSLFGPGLNLGIEGFMKVFSNTNEVDPGANVLLNQQVEADLISSSGDAYGIEFSAEKTDGAFFGSFNYTLSRAFRTIESDFESDQFNNKQKFPANFDRPHNLNFNAVWQPRLRWKLSSFFVFQSGRPYTLPSKTFVQEGRLVFITEEINNRRIPHTARMDIAVTISGSYKREPRWEHSVTFSVYNLFGINNAFSVQPIVREDNSIDLVQLTVLGEPFPSITYNLKFNGKNN